MVLIPWGKTAWSEADRLSSRVPLSLSDSGELQVDAWAEELAGIELHTLYCSDEPASIETVRIVARRGRARQRVMLELAEVDTGLWAGLTRDELKRRYPKVFKKWWSDSTSVSPPEGESVTAAFQRLQEAVEQMTRQEGSRSFAVVAGPLAFALIRCMMESVNPARMQTLLHAGPLRYPLVG